VTFQENYDALKAKGDYLAAGITLIQWQSLPAERQATLWKEMLRGRMLSLAGNQQAASAGCNQWHKSLPGYEAQLGLAAEFCPFPTG
jgi:hypothetical protein